MSIKSQKRLEILIKRRTEAKERVSGFRFELFVEAFWIRANYVDPERSPRVVNICLQASETFSSFFSIWHNPLPSLVDFYGSLQVYTFYEQP